MTAATPPAYNDANFRAQYPAFANVAVFPTATLQANWNVAGAFVKTNAPDWLINDAQGQLMLDLMAAQITQLQYNQAQAALNGNPTGGGAAAGALIQATEGTVSVGFAPPPQKSSLQAWLNQTPYGQQLLALLNVLTSVGWYSGGSPERRGFRKVYGHF